MEDKYQKALERARVYYNNAKEAGDYSSVARYENIFPELKEDEDDRIRKEILDCFQSMKAQGCFPSRHKEQYTTWIAWLEKQKEKSAIPDELVECYKEFGKKFTGDFKVFVNSLNNYNEMQKQKEQKPIKWTELTWKDIVELEGIINNVHYDFSAGIDQESFGKEVLERFRSTKGVEYLDEAEQKYWQEDEQKLTTLKIERDKWYVCIKDFYAGGKKHCSKGDLVQAKGGMYMMGLDEENAAKYFFHVNYEQKPVEYLSKRKVYDIMNKLTELSTSDLIPFESEEYVKIHEITSDVFDLLNYPIEQKSKMIPKWLYRLEFKDSSCGLWYNGRGKWCFKSGIGSIEGCKTKSLPMDYDERYKQDGRDWFSSCSCKEDLLHWYSLEDAKQLIEKGFVFTRYLATEYHEYKQETVFIKETALYREEIDIFELFKQKEQNPAKDIITNEVLFQKKRVGLNRIEEYILSLTPSRSIEAIKVDAKNLRYLAQEEQKSTVEVDKESDIQKSFREGQNAGRKEVFDHPGHYGLQPITEVMGFKIGDKVRLKDGDGRTHIIKSFEEIEGIHGPNFYHVIFEDNTATDRIIPGKEYIDGYFTQMEKIEEEQKEQKSVLEKTFESYKISDELAYAKMEGVIKGRQDVINNPEEYGLMKQKPVEKQDCSDLTDFESALFTAFSDAWQQYLGGEDVNVTQWVKEHSTELLKAATQKPTEWSEEDSNIIETLIKELRTNAQFELAVNKIGLNYVQTLTTLDKCPRLKQEWSKEDEKQMQQIERIVESTGCSKKLQEKIHNWFKSLHPQPKQEWKRYIWHNLMRFEHSALVNYDNNYGYEIVSAGCKPKIECNGSYVFLSDIAPQLHWKPSEEQIESLAKAINLLGEDGNHKTAAILNELRINLKKLI